MVKSSMAFCVFIAKMVRSSQSLRPLRIKVTVRLFCGVKGCRYMAGLDA